MSRPSSGAETSSVELPAGAGRNGAGMSFRYHEGSRGLQDRFDTRRLPTCLTRGSPPARPSRLRPNGVASIDDRNEQVDRYPGAQFVVRVHAAEVFPNCQRYIHRMALVERSRYVPRADRGAADSRMEAVGVGLRRSPGERSSSAGLTGSADRVAIVMAYDEDLANRIREIVMTESGVSEKKMFGGLAFLINGNMSVSASGKGGLLLHVDPDQSDSLLAKPHAHPFEMRGRVMQGWLRVDADGVRTKRQLERWVSRGVGYARSLPAK
jgi:TfoX N-terminal domain